PANPVDACAIWDVVSSAFGGDDEARLVAALDKAGDTVVSRVAEADGAIVGHVLLSRMSGSFRALALAPVAVGAEGQGLGGGSALIRAAIDRARTDGWDAVFVLGDVGYYRRFGFDAELARGFTSPYAGEHFMALALAGEPPCLTGVLEHAP